MNRLALTAIVTSVALASSAGHAAVAAPTSPKPVDCQQAIPGSWQWGWGTPIVVYGTVDFRADKRMTYNDKEGTWRCDGVTATLTWDGGKSVNRMVLAADGRTMRGTNGTGTLQVQATRTVPIQALSELKSRIASGDFGNIHSVVIMRNGKRLHEWYFSGSDERLGRRLGNITFTADTLHDVRSVTKSVTSILFGIALHDGAIKNLDQPVLDFFPEYPDLHTPDHMQIRLRDLLSMTSGLHWDERTIVYTDPRNSETAMNSAADRYRYILSQPVDAKPGTRWAYSGGDTALIGEVVARATHTSLDVYAERKLFRPLHITQFEWIRDRKSIPMSAVGLRLRPRDMAKIGQLMLHHGRWGSAQIVPADWVDSSTSRHAQLSPDLTCGRQYGHFWWLGTICDGNDHQPYYFANGNGGQMIWVDPSLGLVVVTTAGFYNSPAPDPSSIPLTVARLERGKPGR